MNMFYGGSGELYFVTRGLLTWPAVCGSVGDVAFRVLTYGTTSYVVPK